MLRSLHIANRNLNVLQKKLENNNANMSNIKTAGYKFQDVVESTLESKDMINYQGTKKVNKKQDVGNFTFGNRIDDYYRNFDQSSLINTLMDTDFAIDGDGFFALRLADGQIGYTRNGNFRLDDDNRLVSIEGNPVLGISDRGNLQEIYLDMDEIKVDSLGNFNNSDMKFAIVSFDNVQNLESVGDTIFVTDEQGIIYGNTSIRQGFLENSNVNMADSIVSLIEISRQFESSQKLVQMADETMSKAVNDIGRV